MFLLWIILFFSVFAYWLSLRQRRLNIPGPRGLPIVGSVFQIDKIRPHMTMEKWAKQYGPVMCVKTFNQQIVYANTYETVHEALIEKTDDFAARPGSYRTNILTHGRKDLIFASPDFPHLHILRRIALRHINLHSSGNESSEFLVSKILQENLQKLHETKGKPIDMESPIRMFTLNSLHCMLFGKELDDETEKRFWEDMDATFLPNIDTTAQGMILDEFPFLRFIPGSFSNKLYNRLVNVTKKADNFFERKNLEFRDDVLDQAPECLMKALCEAKNTHDQKHEHILEDVHIHLSVLELMVAGLGATTIAMYIFIILLQHYPEVMRKLQKEVDSVVGGGRSVSVKDRENMPYTRAAILEMLRYASIPPMIVPHAAMRDTTLGGYFIPKGTVISPNLWMQHHDEKHWGDPYEYRPERYLDESGDLVAPNHPNRKRMMTFGGGSRVCVGEVLALNHLFLYISWLMQRFDILPEDKNNLPNRDLRTYQVTVVPIPPTHKVRLIPR